MGNPYYSDDTARMCYNGAKSWHLGWYDDRHITIDPTAGYSWEGKLAGIDDYLNGQTIQNEHHVIAKVDNIGTSWDLFIMYNRQEGVNSQVDEGGNLVTVVEAINDSRSRQSYLMAKIDAGENYRLSNFNGGNGMYDLVVEVCELVSGTPDYARVLIYLCEMRCRPYPMRLNGDA